MGTGFSVAPTVNREVSNIGRDQSGPRELFRKDHQRGVAHVHARGELDHQFGAAADVLGKDRQQPDMAGLNRIEQPEQGWRVGFEVVRGLGEDRLSGPDGRSE